MSSEVKLPRGIRNNNPLNIRLSKDKWQGQINGKGNIDGNSSLSSERAGGEAVFCVFSSMAYGWRAAFLLLHTYMSKYKLTTVRKIIYRWAPPNENNTAAYTNHVCYLAHLDPNQEIEFGNKLTMLQIGRAMCQVENGLQYDPINRKEWLEALDEGYEMALRNAKK